jgi:hypothetical protein
MLVTMIGMMFLGAAGHSVLPLLDAVRRHGRPLPFGNLLHALSINRIA